MGFLKVKEICPRGQYDTAEQVVRAILGGTYRSNCLVPVKESFRDILGAACWICADKRIAERKRVSAEHLVFTVPEFMVMIETARSGMDALISVIDGKRRFGGVIDEGG